MGKMDFYLEALDRDVKKPQENPSVGMILCKNADTDVVEYSLNRSLSQTMIAGNKTKLIDKNILQRKLAELYDMAEEEVKNSQSDWEFLRYIDFEIGYHRKFIDRMASAFYFLFIPPHSKTVYNTKK